MLAWRNEANSRHGTNELNDLQLKIGFAHNHRAQDPERRRMAARTCLKRSSCSHREESYAKIRARAAAITLAGHVTNLGEKRVRSQPGVRLELAADGAEDRGVVLVPRLLVGELGSYPRQLPEDLWRGRRSHVCTHVASRAGRGGRPRIRA